MAQVFVFSMILDLAVCVLKPSKS